MRPHVIPLNDHLEHIVSERCFCLPLVQVDVVIHHARDLRDVLERVGHPDPKKPWAVIIEP